ncbi:MAG: bifunctional folylpolyglutamate synthase/dihydrofolate synthase [Treponema sp.]|nr:bifunctional folylpolyglutamate synthase/dihydrofolate synthase [Treponema sp.]
MSTNSDESLHFFIEWIDRYLNFERTPKKNIFWLDTMKFLCEKLHHPETYCPCFHVAGSKGKGSISAMIAGILEEKGLRTGVYTSPHILDFKERVGYGNKPFEFEVYHKSAYELMNVVDSIPLEEFPAQRPVTWFELVTLFAMLCFRNARVDYAVWEVGLGGRLDATNVVQPVCCCIGPIELEHKEFLGDTIEKIAKEKGGIIKKATPVVCARQTDEAYKALQDIASSLNAPFIQVEKNARISNAVYNIRHNFCESIKNNTLKDAPFITLDADISSPLFQKDVHVALQMLGDVQVENAALAALAVKHVFPDIDESMIGRGASRAYLPARFEMTASSLHPNIPFIVLDGAHTANSIHITMKTYRHIVVALQDKLHESMQKPFLLFACAADKDVEDIAIHFKDECSRIVLTRPGNVKQSDVQRAAKAFTSEKIDCTVIEDYEKAIEVLFDTANKERVPVLVAGSFYLVAEVKSYLRNLQL